MKTKGKVLVNQEKIRDIAGIKLNVLFIFIIAVISIAVYINSLPNGFLFDDKTIVESNPIIRDLKIFLKYLHRTTGKTRLTKRKSCCIGL